PLSISAADMSPQDRAARCANNQARIDALNTELKSNRDFASDNEIGRLRHMLSEVRRLKTIAVNTDDVAVAGGALFRLRNLGHAIGVDCDTGNAISCGNLDQAIGKKIDKAVAARARYQEIQTELAQYHSRMIELQCIAPPPPEGVSPSTGIHVTSATLGA